VFDPACVHHPWYSVGAGAAEACREIYRAGPVRIVNWDYGSWFFQLVARGSLDVDARDGNMTMALRLRRLTEREHRLCAPLLAFVVTFIFADRTFLSFCILHDLNADGFNPAVNSNLACPKSIYGDRGRDV